MTAGKARLIAIFSISVIGVCAIAFLGFKIFWKPKLEVAFFYTTICAPCEGMEDFIDSVWSFQNLNNKYRVTIESVNVSGEGQVDMLLEYYDKYEVEQKDQSMPILFVGDKYFTGELEIEKAIKAHLQQ